MKFVDTNPVENGRVRLAIKHRLHKYHNVINQLSLFCIDRQRVKFLDNPYGSLVTRKHFRPHRLAIIGRIHRDAARKQAGKMSLVLVANTKRNLTDCQVRRFE